MNGTFVLSGATGTACRLPAHQDCTVAHGDLVYFGAKDYVLCANDTQQPNPFVYVYESSTIGSLQAQGQLQQQDSRPQPAAQQAHQNSRQPSQQQIEHPQLENRHRRRTDMEASAPKRQKLSCSEHAAAGPASLPGRPQLPQQGAAVDSSMPAPGCAARSPVDSSVSVEIVAEAALPTRHHGMQHGQMQQRQSTQGMRVGSEPEVLQQLQQPLQDALIIQQEHSEPQQWQIPQQQQAPQQQHQSTIVQQPDVHSQQQRPKAENTPAPLAERDVNVPQKTPGSNRKRFKAAERPSPMSPAMRISASSLECAVCKDIMVAPHSLGCGHSFCGPCLELWLERPKPTCPTCRRQVTSAPVLQCTLNSIVLEVGIPGDSEDKDRAARLAAWNAVKDVTLAHWKDRFGDAREDKPRKQSGNASRQQMRAAAATAGPQAARAQPQQQHRSAGVVSLLPGRRPTAAAPAAAQPAPARPALGRQQAARRHSARVGAAAAAAAARASQAAAAAAALVHRAMSRSGSGRRARGRGSANAATARTGSAQHAVQQVQARQLQGCHPQQQQQQRQLQQQQLGQLPARPRAQRQAAIDSFLARAVPVRP